MLHPVGPLPASVYWRRRVVVFAAVVALLVLLVAWLGGGKGSGTPGSRQAASSASASPDGAGAATGTDSPTQQPPSDSLGGTPPPVSASDAAGGGGTVGAGGFGDPPPANPSSPCPDTALRLTVGTAVASYRVGTKPVITLTVQNVSSTTCTRDLGAAQQEVLLYAGATRLWSSNDCYPGGQRYVRALRPQQRATFSVTWSGLSSRPRCAGTRTRVGAGTYRLLGRLGTLRSPDGRLVLR
jgi:hypothetical protein